MSAAPIREIEHSQRPYSERSLQRDEVARDAVNGFLRDDRPTILKLRRDIHWLPLDRCLHACERS